MTIYKEIDFEIDIDDVWNELTDKEKREFLEEKKTSVSIDEFQDFAYQLNNEDAENLIRWLKFYNKLEIN